MLVDDAQVKGPAADGLDTEDDFLARERAALGDDAAQFAGTGTAADAANDLLGDDSGDAPPPSNEQTQFETSFPSIDTQNEVCAWILSRP